MTLDEAVKLVPAGWNWQIIKRNDISTTARAIVWRYTNEPGHTFECTLLSPATALEAAARRAREALGLPDPVATYPAESEKLPEEDDAVPARAMASAVAAVETWSDLYPDIRLARREWGALTDAIYRQIEPLMRGDG